MLNSDDDLEAIKDADAYDTSHKAAYLSNSECRLRLWLVAAISSFQRS